MKYDQAISRCARNIGGSNFTVYASMEDWNHAYDVSDGSVEIDLAVFRSYDSIGTRSLAGDNIVLNEIATLPDNAEWVEVVNPTNLPIDMAGWYIQVQIRGWRTIYTYPAGTIAGAWDSGSENAYLPQFRGHLLTGRKGILITGPISLPNIFPNLKQGLRNLPKKTLKFRFRSTPLSLLNSSFSAQGVSDTLDIYVELPDTYFVVITYDESPSQQISSAILLIAENWGFEQSSKNDIQLNEGHYLDFLLSEVHAYWVDVTNVQGQDMTIQVEWTPSLGADLRIYPFTRNSQKTEYDPLDPSNPPVLSLARSDLPQSQNSTYQIARDVERLLLVTTNVQGNGNLSIQLSYSNPRIDFWSYNSHRKEVLGSLMILSIIGLFILAYFGEKYLR